MKSNMESIYMAAFIAGMFILGATIILLVKFRKNNRGCRLLSHSASAEQSVGEDDAVSITD